MEIESRKQFEHETNKNGKRKTEITIKTII
jgi:hypothetical protein